MNYFDAYPDNRAVLIEGVAGGGKTTLIANHAKDCVRFGLRTLLITFSESGATVLTDYMTRAGLPPDKHKNFLSIYTIDELALEILRRWRDNRHLLKKDFIVRHLLPSVLEKSIVRLEGRLEVSPSKDNVHDLNNLMRDIDYFRASGAYRIDDNDEREYACGDNLNFEFPLVQQAFNYYEDLRQSWYPPQDVLELFPAGDYEESTPWADQLDSYEARGKNNLTGFRTSSEAVSDLFEHPRFTGSQDSISRLFNFKYVLIDEFHDTTPLQFEFLAEVCKNSNRILAVGDKHQNIYAWRGTNPDVVFDLYKQRFLPSVVKLNQSYRFGSGLANALSGFIGSGDWRSFADHRTSIKFSQDEIGVLIRRLYEKEELLNAAIICRDSSNLVETAFGAIEVLNDVGGVINFSVSSAFSCGIATLLTSLLMPEIEWRDENLREAIRQFVELPHCLLDAKGCEAMLLATEPSERQTRKDKVGYVLSGNLRTYVDSQLARGGYYIPSMEEALRDWLSTDVNGSLGLSLKKFQAKSGLLKIASGAARHTVASRSMIRSWHALLDYVEKHNVKVKEWPVVLRKLNAICNKSSTVELLSVEEAKGRQFDHVIVYGLNDGEFPANGEELRLECNRFYVAASRARLSLLLVANKEPGMFFTLWRERSQRG